MFSFLSFIPNIFKQFKFAKQSKTLLGLLVCLILLGISGYFNYSQYNINVNLTETNKQSILIISEKDSEIKKLNSVIDIYKSEIQKLKDQSSEYQLKLSQQNTEIISQNFKDEIQSLQKWETIKFVNICEKDVDNLRKHALDIKGKWK